MKKKLKITNIPDLQLEDCQGVIHAFNEFYDYMGSLGCGGFGFVVSSVHKNSGDRVALKIIDTAIGQAAVKAFDQESELLGQLDHPNVIKYKHHMNFDNYHILALEEARGGSLLDLIAARRK